MKNYFVLIFSVLLIFSVGISCKSSSSTDGNSPAKTTTSTGENANSVAPEVKKRIDANTAKKEDERVTTAMMKRAEVLAKSHCNCVNNVNKERCEERIQKSYDATLSRLAEDKHSDFKATYDAAVAACK